MKFTVSTSALTERLQNLGRIISSKPTIQVLSNFYLCVADNKLTIIASDLETTAITSMPLEHSDGDITMTVPAQLLINTLCAFSEQPLEFDVNEENLTVQLNTVSGKYNFIGMRANEYPQLPVLEADKKNFSISSTQLLNGITRTIFAAATENLRPALMGIYFDLRPNELTLVTTNAHELVRLNYTDIDCALEAGTSFILPPKSAGMLKNLLAHIDEDVNIAFDSKNVCLQWTDYTIYCRRIEGIYPNYNSVIPSESPYEIVVDRQNFLSSVRRVQVFADKGTLQVRLEIANGQINLKAQDIDFSTSAEEHVPCQFNGDRIVIGFKASVLGDILNNIGSQNICIRLSDATRAGIILPAENAKNEDLLMLLTE